MQKAKSRFRGFTLIASLLLLLLMSGIAIGLLTMVNTEARVGGNDLENNLAYHSAEGAMEKMASDLSNIYRSSLAPTAGDIDALKYLKPTNDPYVTYPDYSLTPHFKSDGVTLDTDYGKISSGPYKDLYAQILQIDLKATAQRPLGDQVSMMRTVEVALIPVFQFGVFSDSDLGFFSSPDLDFAGRVHTNGDLYLGVANCCTITFHDKITAYGEVIRKRLPNGLASSSNNNNGVVDILTQSGGCDGAQPGCQAMSQSWGSVIDGPGSGYNSGPPSWYTVSTAAPPSGYNGWIINGNWGGTNGTGVKPLKLPFVSGGAASYEIIRRPVPGESATSPVGGSRLYNQAQVRVLLADDPAELPGGQNDSANIRLANIPAANGRPNYSNGVPAPTVSGLPALGGGATYNTFFAEGTSGIPDPTSCPSSSACTTNTLPLDMPITAVAPTGSEVLFPAGAPTVSTATAAKPIPITIATTGSSATAPAYPNYPVVAANATDNWNLVDGWIRVEIRKTDGTYAPVTKEWLERGFARGLNAPTGGAGTNPVNPNAILIFQKLADRNNDSALDYAGVAASCTGSGSSKKCIGKPPEARKHTAASVNATAYYGTSTGGFAFTKNNYYPINFYDAREGEVRDAVLNNTTCAVNGLMNAVEVDVANLRNWLRNTATGQLTEYTSQNGYILYFSDRRGMVKNPDGTPVDPTNTKNTKTGDSGLEDSINTPNANGTPDGALEAVPSGKTTSPEDVNINGKLDKFGAKNLGLGFGQNGNVNAPNPPNPYVRMDCPTTGRKNWVSGARHVLKLVNGSLGSLPTKPDDTGGFTVASENPVYIQGDYNSNSTDPSWSSSTEPLHAAAAVIADAVTLLSNAWTEKISLDDPSDARNGPRPAVTTRYRVAIAAGKSVNFPIPSFAGGTTYAFGTDGGLHNFLRFLEDWNNDNLFYKGSLVSLYYSTYNTGTFKCCAYSVYQPPDRNYVFDPLFASPSGLPPGTPMFRDIENLSYRQDFTARTQ